MGFSVEVVDWAEVGPLFERRDPEDGTVYACRPDSAAVVQLVTDRGEVYNHHYDFGTDFDAAERFASQVRAAGTFDPSYWYFDRAIYGSAAYVEGGYEEAWAARERADYESGLVA